MQKHAATNHVIFVEITALTGMSLSSMKVRRYHVEISRKFSGRISLLMGQRSVVPSQQNSETLAATLAP
jgi:hypothetical protein